MSSPCPNRSIFPNWENNLFFSSLVIPIPLSWIEIKIELSVIADLTSIFQLGGVYFIALLSKLLITRWICSGSKLVINLSCISVLTS